MTLSNPRGFIVESFPAYCTRLLYKHDRHDHVVDTILAYLGWCPTTPSKVNYSLCSVHQQVWWSLTWGLRQGRAGGLWGCCFAGFWIFSEEEAALDQPQRIEPSQCVSGQSWASHQALQGQMQFLQCAVGVVEPALGAKAGLGLRVVWGLWFCRHVETFFQRRRQHLATSVCRALPVSAWSVLSIPWGTARSNTASEVCSRSSGACTGCCGRAEQVV